MPGGAKLVVVDLATDTVERTYRFDATVAPETSYLNDLRLDLETSLGQHLRQGVEATAMDLGRQQLLGPLTGHREVVVAEEDGQSAATMCRNTGLFWPNGPILTADFRKYFTIDVYTGLKYDSHIFDPL